MTPLPFTWDGEVMRPRHPRAADRAYVIGQDYSLAPVEDRSQRSHAHEFAFVGEAFENLPEAAAGRWANADHLRKWALIKAGFCTVQDHICASAAEAGRTRLLVAALEPYAIVEVREGVVRIMRAESQSRRAADRVRFQAQKDGVLRILAEELGVQPVELAKAAA